MVNGEVPGQAIMPERAGRSEGLCRSRRLRCAGDECGIFAEHAAFGAGTSWFECRHTGLELGLVNEQVHFILHCVDFDDVAAVTMPSVRPWPLPGDVTDVEPVAATGEAAVCNQCDFLDQAAAGHRTGG